MRSAARSSLAAAFLLLASPAIAQEQQPQGSEGSQIVVTGTRVREEQVRDFVEALTPVGSGSIPRFIDQVCPVAVGLVPAQNELVAARLRQIATAIGLNVAPPGCAANALVVVTNNKRSFIETLALRRPHSFGMMTAHQIRQLARSPGPAAAWQLTGPVNTNGVPLMWDEVLGMFRNNTTEAASRIRSVSHQGFDAATVVIEMGALDGLTVTQLADYAAMRLLAKINPARLPAPPPPTILTILDAPMGSAVPITMTDWDLGLLRGLYTSSPNLQLSSQRSQIARQVVQEVDGAER